MFLEKPKDENLIPVYKEEFENQMLSYIKHVQPERSKREDTFIYRAENYPGPIAIDVKPSKECDEYHKNSKVQINIKSDAVL